MIPGVSDEASGPSYSVVRLCKELIDAGDDASVAALASRPTDVPVHIFPPGFGPPRLGRSPAMARWLTKATHSGSGILHNHGMWHMSGIYPAWATRGTAFRLVMSPRGALSDWAMSHGSPVKKIFWPLFQRPALASVHCFHATAESEAEEIRRRGFRQPIAIIPNGVDIPPASTGPARDVRTILFLGRIHPKKGVDILLRAWKAVMAEFPAWRLRIVGNSEERGSAEGYLDTMKSLASELGVERTEFSEPLYGTEKWAAYRAADVFVLPTHSENFAMTVAEALACGTPAIVTKGAPWAGLVDSRSGWWIDVGVEPLVTCLRTALATAPDGLRDMGAAGHAWMLRAFGWKSIAARMHLTYEWLLQGGARPAWVRTD